MNFPWSEPWAVDADLLLYSLRRRSAAFALWMVIWKKPDLSGAGYIMHRTFIWDMLIFTIFVSPVFHVCVLREAGASVDPHDVCTTVGSIYFIVLCE